MLSKSTKYELHLTLRFLSPMLDDENEKQINFKRVIFLMGEKHLKLLATEQSKCKNLLKYAQVFWETAVSR